LQLKYANYRMIWKLLLIFTVDINPFVPLIMYFQIWQMRTGTRLRTIACAKGSKMLQPSYRFGASMSSPYVPLEVFLLNGDSGQISVLNRTLDSWYFDIFFSTRPETMYFLEKSLIDDLHTLDRML
jgi:hypothetical protein